MAQHDRKDCYGRMFPSTLTLQTDRPVSGKAFSYEVTKAGGTFVSRRSVAVNVPEWDDCVKCAEFDPCYKLSMGRLALETAVSD
jgi:hypothetical protein